MCNRDGLAKAVSAEAFRRGLIVETSGPQDEVIKLLPPLTIEDADLLEGVSILGASVSAVIG